MKVYKQMKADKKFSENQLGIVEKMIGIFNEKIFRTENIAFLKAALKEFDEYYEEYKILFTDISLESQNKLIEIMNLKDFFNSRNRQNVMPLHFSAEHGLTNIFKWLLVIGANIGQLDIYGNSVLYVSAYFSRNEIFSHCLNKWPKNTPIPSNVFLIILNNQNFDLAVLLLNHIVNHRSAEIMIYEQDMQKLLDVAKQSTDMEKDLLDSLSRYRKQFSENEDSVNTSADLSNKKITWKPKEAISFALTHVESARNILSPKQLLEGIGSASRDGRKMAIKALFLMTNHEAKHYQERLLERWVGSNRFNEIIKYYGIDFETLNKLTHIPTALRVHIESNKKQALIKNQGMDKKETLIRNKLSLINPWIQIYTILNLIKNSNLQNYKLVLQSVSIGKLDKIENKPSEKKSNLFAFFNSLFQSSPKKTISQQGHVTQQTPRTLLTASLEFVSTRLSKLNSSSRDWLEIEDLFMGLETLIPSLDKESCDKLLVDFVSWRVKHIIAREHFHRVQGYSSQCLELLLKRIGDLGQLEPVKKMFLSHLDTNNTNLKSGKCIYFDNYCVLIPLLKEQDIKQHLEKLIKLMDTVDSFGEAVLNTFIQHHFAGNTLSLLAFMHEEHILPQQDKSLLCLMLMLIRSGNTKNVLFENIWPTLIKFENKLPALFYAYYTYSVPYLLIYQLGKVLEEVLNDDNILKLYFQLGNFHDHPEFRDVIKDITEGLSANGACRLLEELYPFSFSYGNMIYIEKIIPRSIIKFSRIQVDAVVSALCQENSGLNKLLYHVNGYNYVKHILLSLPFDEQQITKLTAYFTDLQEEKKQDVGELQAIMQLQQVMILRKNNNDNNESLMELTKELSAKNQLHILESWLSIQIQHQGQFAPTLGSALYAMLSIKNNNIKNCALTVLNQLEPAALITALNPDLLLTAMTNILNIMMRYSYKSDDVLMILKTLFSSNTRFDVENLKNLAVSLMSSLGWDYDINKTINKHICDLIVKLLVYADNQELLTNDKGIVDIYYKDILLILNVFCKNYSELLKIMKIIGKHIALEQQIDFIEKLELSSVSSGLLPEIVVLLHFLNVEIENNRPEVIRKLAEEKDEHIRLNLLKHLAIISDKLTPKEKKIVFEIVQTDIQVRRGGTVSHALPLISMLAHYDDINNFWSLIDKIFPAKLGLNYIFELLQPMVPSMDKKRLLAMLLHSLTAINECNSKELIQLATNLTMNIVGRLYELDNDFTVKLFLKPEELQGEDKRLAEGVTSLLNEMYTSVPAEWLAVVNDLAKESLSTDLTPSPETSSPEASF